MAQFQKDLDRKIQTCSNKRQRPFIRRDDNKIVKSTEPMCHFQPIMAPNTFGERI